MGSVVDEAPYEQLNLFSNYEDVQREQEKEKAALDKEHRRQEAILSLRKRYGKNIILRGMNLEEGATARERNSQIGGHKA